MDNDDSPNFAYAYDAGASEASPAASWNPALRHEKEGATAAPEERTQPSQQVAPPVVQPVQPRVQSKPEQEDSSEDEDEDEDEDEEGQDDEPQRKHVAVEEEDDDDEDEEDSDEDESEDEESPAVSAPPPPTRTAPPKTEASLPSSNPMMENSAASRTSPQPQSRPQPQTQTQTAAVESSDESESEEESEEESSEDEEQPRAAEERPAENYEHQGETTALEDAVIESVKVPLVADTEADEWGSSDNFDLGGASQPAPPETLLETPVAEALGTTVGDTIIGNTTVGGNAGDDLDWGNTEEQDDFFVGGNAAVQTVESSDNTQLTPGAHVTNSEPQPSSEPALDLDLDLDLDDEFLPDTEDAPVFDLSDDDGFLEDDTSTAPQQAAVPAQTAAAPTNRYAPLSGQAGPNTASIANQHAQRGLPPSPVVPAYSGYGQNPAYQQQPARPAMSSSAQSFADKAKGGYASPYDMPDDIVTTRKRPAPRPSMPTTQSTPPPPRTSSMSSTTGPPRPVLASNMSTASLSPPSSSHSAQAQMTGVIPPKPAAPAKSPSSDFFAELPITSKPRPSGRYTPQPNAPTATPSQHAPPQYPSKDRAPSWSSLRNEVLPDGAGTPPAPFRQPEQLPMFPSQPSVPARTNSLPVPQPTTGPPSGRYSPAPPPSGPAANARYSPAPPSAPAQNARYSPAPPPGAQGQAHARYASEPSHTLHRTPSQPFAPRTSSPLAFHSMPQQPQAGDSDQSSNHQISQSLDGISRPPFKSPLGEVSELEEQEMILSSRPPTSGRSETPPPPRSTASSVVGSPRKRSTYVPHQYQPVEAALPQRSQSQSPSAIAKPPVRSMSAAGSSGSAFGISSMPAGYGMQFAKPDTVNTIPHRRQASLNYDCIAPEDERAADPLQRWRGHPVFAWGLGGTIVTSFPKQIPRYGGGGSAPMMKCSPGEVKVASVKELLPLPEDAAKFPGPLKGKTKKKDIQSWLTRKIETLEARLRDPSVEQSSSRDEYKRIEDKILLWKLLHTLVELDGRLDGAAAEAAIKKLFSLGSDEPADADANFSTAADIVGRSRSNTANLSAELTDPKTVEELQNMLIKGDREKAVWHAVDQRLWGHAMLLSSTLSKDIWKQVVQEFVRKEVKKVGHSNQALAVLYEVFAGNHEDCIDELVPASARAGFQMVSADGGGPAQNALQGLDKWRDTVALIMHNRSEGDVTALRSLGRLLLQYGRVEAAHICFILARSVIHVSGADDAQADFVLIGADHKQYPLELGIDIEPIMLTEVYEFALSLSSQAGSHVIPHLQNYKLAHAYQLAEHGYRTEAQAYCDAIPAAMKATTRISPYYSASFIANLDDLTKRLSQSPRDNPSNWVSIPNMDKVGSSILSKFNSFIQGDDEDAANNGQGVQAGPFANIAGDSPSITPAQSSADLYGAYAGYGAPTQVPVPGNSRYAPSNAYTPRSSSEQQRPRYEPQGRPSMDSMDGPSGRAVSDTHMPMTPSFGQYSPSQTQFSPPRSQAKAVSYSPLRAEHVAQPALGSPYLPAPSGEESASSPAFSSYGTPQMGFGGPIAEETQSTNGYEPPSSTFKAPAYQPYNPAEDDEEDKKDEPLKKKKSFMDLDDDDDELAKRAAALKISGKTDADKKADEAFRKAAEADAQKDKDAAAGKKGWFGGWFKKDPNAAPGPVKAKLGEENSFVYDPELKKWVNKKGGATDSARPTATPPPPRAGPPTGPGRAASGGAPPMGPPAGLRPPTSNPSGPQRSSSMPPPMAPGSRSSTPGIPSDAPSDSEGPKPPALARPSFGAASGPPSRPGTSMSNASSIDDLLGAPQARKGAGAKKKKAGRYVDVMAQGS